MERRNFLKGIFATGALFAVGGCTKEDPRPQCEINKVGIVTVKNSTGYIIWTDVTWGNVVENYEKQLYNGNSYKYNPVPAAGHPESNGGTIEIWVSFDGQDWYYEYENLSPCEDMTFTWYLNARKSAFTSNDCPFYTYGPDGKEIIPVLKEKGYKFKNKLKQ